MSTTDDLLEAALDLAKQAVELNNQLLHANLRLQFQLEQLKQKVTTSKGTKRLGPPFPVPHSSTTLPPALQSAARTPTRGRPSTVKPMILEYIRSKGRPVPPSEIIRDLKDRIPTRSANPEHAIRQALSGMVKSGQLVRTPVGYSVPRADVEKSPGEG